MVCENKVQPWRAHFVPTAGNATQVSYQETKGAEIIADGGAVCPAFEDDDAASVAAAESKDAPVGEANKFCPHLGPITNPTL